MDQMPPDPDATVIEKMRSSSGAHLRASYRSVVDAGRRAALPLPGDWCDHGRSDGRYRPDACVAWPRRRRSLHLAAIADIQAKYTKHPLT